MDDQESCKIQTRKGLHFGPKRQNAQMPQPGQGKAKPDSGLHGEKAKKDGFDHRVAVKLGNGSLRGAMCRLSPQPCKMIGQVQGNEDYQNDGKGPMKAA